MKDYKYIDIFSEIVFDSNTYSTQNDVDKFENENRIKLPKDYVDFILDLPILDRYINIDNGYGSCKTVLFKGKSITSELGELGGYGIYGFDKKLINGKERLVVNIGTTSADEEIYQNFYMILDEEEYGVIYHDKYFDMAMHSMFIKVADSFTELLDNVLNGRDLPEDESDNFDMDEDDDECEYFTEEEKKLTHEVPYYF